MTDRTASRGGATAVLVAATLLAGCSFMPVYERPHAPVPPAYAASTPGQAQAADAPAHWQDYFVDPGLRRLIDIALAHNRDLRVAALNIEQARATYQIRRADQFPAIGLAANASRAPAAGTGDLTNAFSVGLAVSAWEIDFFGRIASLKEQALAQYLATEEGRNAAQVSLVAAVANGYLALLADEELLGLSRQTLASREESLRLTRLRFAAGAASELDVRQAQSLTHAARATLAQQERQRALDENALTLLLGEPIPQDTRAALAGAGLSDDSAMATVGAGLPSDLLVRRPDIRQAEQLLIAANANIGAARAAFFPRIALTAQAGTASNELSGLFKNGSWGFSIVPSLLLPLFDAGRNQANLAVSQASRDIAVAQYEKAIQTAFREVSDALAGENTLREQVQAQQELTQAEAARLHLADLRYRSGVASYLELLDAQRSLFAAQQGLVQVRLAQRQNQVNLYKALGGGVSPDASRSAL